MNYKGTALSAWLEFSVDISQPGEIPAPFCGLCGNSGRIDTTRRVTAGVSGKPCGMRGYCICPNGRAYKKLHTNHPKWGGTSVIYDEGPQK